MKCANCGTEFEGKFCPKCGTAAEGNKRSHKGLIIGCVVFLAAAIAAAAAFFVIHQKQTEIISAVQAEEFSYFDDAEQPTYAQLLSTVFPTGEWKYAGGITREETITSVSGEKLTEQVPFKEVDFIAEHTCDSGTEPVRVTFLYSEEYELISGIDMYAGDTSLGENGASIAMLLMRELWLDGEKADEAKRILNMSLTEVEAVCCIADAKTGILDGYQGIVCAQALEEVLPGGEWSYEPDEIDGQSVMGAVVYEAEHTYADGKETVRLEMSGGLSGEVDIWSVLVDGKELDDDAAGLVIDTIVSVYTDDEDAQLSLQLMGASLSDSQGQLVIISVQDGTREDYPGITYGEALEKGFAPGKWSYVGDATVEYTAEHAYLGGTETVRFVFTVDVDTYEIQTDVYVWQTQLSEWGTYILENTVFSAAIGSGDAESIAELQHTSVEDIEDKAVRIALREKVPEGHSVNYTDAIDAAFPAGKWSMIEEGAIEYSAQHSYADGAEEITLTFTVDTEPHISSMEVDGTALSELETYVVAAAVFDAADGDEDAAGALTDPIGDLLASFFVHLFQTLEPEGYANVTHGKAFDVYFEDGAWSYQGDGKVDYDAKFVDGDTSYDVSIQYEMTDMDGNYGMDIYLDGEWLDNDMASQVLTNIFDYYAASVEPESEPESEPKEETASIEETEWCSGIYYSGDLYSTITFYSDGTFEVFFNRQGTISDCTGMVQGNKLTFTGVLDNFEVSGATASGVLTRLENGDLKITITSPEYHGFSISSDTEHFYRNYADEQTCQDIYESDIYDYYSYCGIYANVNEPANQLYVWKNGETTFIDFVCRGEEIAIGDLSEWQIENANDILYFDTYTPTNIEFSAHFDPASEMLEIEGIMPADSVLERRGFAGNYVLQYYYLY